jgi:hypothetical protein
MKLSAAALLVLIACHHFKFLFAETRRAANTNKSEEKARLLPAEVLEHAAYLGMAAMLVGPLFSSDVANPQVSRLGARLCWPCLHHCCVQSLVCIVCRQSSFFEIGDSCLPMEGFVAVAAAGFLTWCITPASHLAGAFQCCMCCTRCCCHYGIPPRAIDAGSCVCLD